MESHQSIQSVWQATHEKPAFTPEQLLAHVTRFREKSYIIEDRQTGHIGASLEHQGCCINQQQLSNNDRFLVLGILPRLYPEWLGERSFNEVHGVRFPYIAGEMAQGISSPQMVIAMARAGMLGMYGAGGLPITQVEKDIQTIQTALGDRNLPWGVNLIHSPQEPQLEEQAVALFLKYGVQCISASAFMRIAKSVVHYTCKGLREDPSGRIIRPHRVLAKVSRPELAERFMSPPPKRILQELLKDNLISEQEAALAEHLPVAEDITVEADSGGHTDNRPLPAMLSAILMLRDQVVAKYKYDRPIRVGAAGGLGTPNAVAAAFTMGAAYVVTGSVNQATLEADQSEQVKELLTQQDVADVVMAPAGDMFEIGAKVQVAKRGFLFAQRGKKLHDIYKTHAGLHELSSELKAKLEKEIFQDSLDNVWQQTKTFWLQRHPTTVTKAEQDAKHKMALTFRWYLGHSSLWARQGQSERQTDFQVWCGPAMGAFNRWVKGSFLESLQNRSVVQIAHNLMEGAALVSRAQQLRSYGVPLSMLAFNVQPRPFSE